MLRYRCRFGRLSVCSLVLWLVVSGCQTPGQPGFHPIWPSQVAEGASPLGVLAGGAGRPQDEIEESLEGLTAVHELARAPDLADYLHPDDDGRIGPLAIVVLAPAVVVVVVAALEVLEDSYEWDFP